MNKPNSTPATKTEKPKQVALQKKLLERLMQTSAALLSGSTREEVLEVILQGVKESGFDRVRLFLLTPDGLTLRGVAQAGMKGERFEEISWLAESDPYFQKMLSQSGPCVFAHDPDDPRKDLFEKHDVPEWAAIPLRLRGRVIGQITADNKFNKLPIQETNLAPLALFAMQAAAAIEKANLKARDEKKLELFAKLAQATTEIVGQIGKKSLYELLTLVARQACEILTAEVCSVFLSGREGFLTLEAGHGHLPDSFKRGLELRICTGIKTGFTGHIAYKGRLVNIHGQTLHTHPAVNSQENTFTPSGLCYSVLALPLKQFTGQQEKLVGLLRADNKKDENGQSHPSMAFTQEDEWILHIFAEIIVVCLESAKLVEQKKLLVENLPQAVIAIDDKGNVTEFNQEAERILGYKAAEVVDKKVNFLYDNPEEPKRVGISLDESVTGKLNGYPTLIRTKSGQSVPINLSAFWLSDHQQRSGSVGIFEDLHKLNDYKQQLELTLHAIRVLAEADNLNLGLKRLADLLVVRFPGAFCGVLLFNEDDTCLVEQAAAYGQGQPNVTTLQSGSPRQIVLKDFPGLAQLLQSGRPFRLRVSGNPLTKANMKKLNESYGFDPPIQSLLVIPIKLGNRVLGVLDLAEVCPEDQSQFSNQHRENIELAAAIATQSAIFIDRLQSAELGRTQLLSFYEVSGKLIAQKNLETLPREIVEATAKAAGAINVDLVLVDEQGRPETAITFPTNHANRKMEVRSEGVSMRVFRSGVAAQFPNTDNARDRLNPELVSFAKAAICLPMSLPYRRIGVMWLHYEKPRYFSEQEVFALQLYVNQAAMAIENAHEEDRQRRLRQTAAAITSETNFIEVRRQILAGGRNLLKADGIVFGFFDDRSKTFVNQLADADGVDKEIWQQYRDRNPGEHITAKELMEKGPFFIKDITDPHENRMLDSVTLKSLERTSVKSFLAVPLKVGDEQLGLVCALYQHPRSFNEKEQRTAVSFARYAALGLKNSRLFNQVKKTKEAATAVAKITILGHRQKTLDAVIEEISNVTDADAVVLFEYDADKDKLLKPSVSGLIYPERALSDDEEKDHSVVRELLNSKERFQVVQIAEHPDYSSRRFARDENIASFVAFPLQTAGRKVGVLFVNFRTQRQFTAEELETMQLFAHQAAVAIHYAQATEADERKLKELKALEKLSDQLRQAQSLQEMMDITVALAAEELETEFCNLILPERDEKLHLRAQYGWNPPLNSFVLETGTGSQVGYTILTGKPFAVYDYAVEPPFKVIDHLPVYRVKSSLSVPMFRDKKIVGALITFTTNQRRFSEEEVRFFELIANHAAMAMRSMERYEDLQRWEKHLRAAHNSSRAILASFGDEQKVLDEIVKEAVEGITIINEPKALMGTLQLYDAERNELVMRSIYPPETLPLLMARVDNGRWSLDKSKALFGRIGVTGRTIKEGKSQLVGDLNNDPDYIKYNEKTISELSVPLIANGKVIGAINVESDLLNGFDENDKIAIEALADHAVIAMQIAHTHKELRETKGLVGTRTAMAWMGLANNAWRHTIAGDAAELANRVTLMREYLGEHEIADERLYRHLAQMELLAKSIQERPVTPPLSSEEGVSLININELVTERLNQLRQNNRYEGIEIIDATQTESLLVNVSSEWLRRALDILIDNGARAVRLMSSAAPNRCKVTVSTTLNGNMVDLCVMDCGTGIPAEVLDKLFIGKIESAKGHGVGLLIAQAIAETYGGKIEVARTDTEGTEMLIRLPLFSERR